MLRFAQRRHRLTLLFLLGAAACGTRSPLRADEDAGAAAPADEPAAATQPEAEQRPRMEQAPRARTDKRAPQRPPALPQSTPRVVMGGNVGGLGNQTGPLGLAVMRSYRDYVAGQHVTQDSRIGDHAYLMTLDLKPPMSEGAGMDEAELTGGVAALFCDAMKLHSAATLGLTTVRDGEKTSRLFLRKDAKRIASLLEHEGKLTLRVQAARGKAGHEGVVADREKGSDVPAEYRKLFLELAAELGRLDEQCRLVGHGGRPMARNVVPLNAAPAE